MGTRNLGLISHLRIPFSISVLLKQYAAMVCPCSPLGRSSFEMGIKVVEIVGTFSLPSTLLRQLSTPFPASTRCQAGTNLPPSTITSQAVKNTAYATLPPSPPRPKSV